MQLVYIQNVANPLSSISLNTQEKMQKWTHQFINIFFWGGGEGGGGGVNNLHYGLCVKANS